MKKIEAKVYGNPGWVIFSESNEVWGFVWKPSSGSFRFRYETFGTYSESGFGESVEDCLKYIKDIKQLGS